MLLAYHDLTGARARHEIAVTVTNEHAASSYGLPVIVLPDGEALSVASYILLDYVVVRATPDEMTALAQALSPYAVPV